MPRRSQSQIQADLESNAVLCGLCFKPLEKLGEKPGVPTYHASCAQTAGVAQGPIYQKPTLASVRQRAAAGVTEEEDDLEEPEETIE